MSNQSVINTVHTYAKARDTTIYESQIIIMVISAHMILTTFVIKMTRLMKCPVGRKFIMAFVAIMLALLLKYVNSHAFQNFDIMDARNAINYLYPLLVLKTTYNLDFQLFVRYLPQILVLAIPGTMIFASLMGLVLFTFASVDNPFFIPLYGLTIASVDYLELADCLKEFEKVRYILVTLEGESIVGMAVCLLFVDMFLGAESRILVFSMQFFCFFTRYIALSVIIGVIVGKLMHLILELTFNDSISTCFFLLGVMYSVFFMCQYTLFTSGPIAIIIVGFFINRNRSRLSSDIDKGTQATLEFVLQLVESVLYLFVVIDIFAEYLRHFRKESMFNYVYMYINAIISRVVMLFLLSPMLMLIGAGYYFKGLIALAWLAKKGVMQIAIYQAVFANDKNMADNVAQTLFYFLMSLLINGSTTLIFLKIYGLTTVGKTKKANINNCIRTIEAKRLQYINVMRTNRYLADVNWQLVEMNSKVKHPYSSEPDEEESDMGIKMIRKSYCGDCHKVITIQPTRQELMQMQDEAKIRLLKTQKISFIHQHEKGLLTIEGLKYLLHAVDESMETDELVLKNEEFLLQFTKRLSYECFRDYLIEVQEYELSRTPPPPRKKYRRVIYDLTSTKWWDIGLYALIVIHVGFYAYFYVVRAEYTILKPVVDVIFTVIYAAHIILKILSYSHVYVREGIKYYFSSAWNCLFVLMWVVDLLDYFLWHLASDEFLQYSYDLDFVPVMRLLMIVPMIALSRKQMIWFCERKMHTRLSILFDISQALINSYDGALHVLPDIVDHPVVLKNLRSMMDHEKAQLWKYVNKTLMKMSNLSVTVKSKQCMRATLNHMRICSVSVKTAGLIDDFEFVQLSIWFEKYIKSVSKLRKVAKPTSDQMFNELVWMDGGAEICAFVSINTTIMTWEPDEIIVHIGYIYNALFLIIDGYVSLTYTPSEVNQLEEGIPPVLDYYSNPKFNEPISKFLIPGNTFGEMGVMTKRPSDCSITAVTPLKALVIPSKNIHEAIALQNDPIESLHSSIWKHIAINVAEKLLWESPIYNHMIKEDLKHMTITAFVPDLSGREIFMTTKHVKEIILIEGMVEDLHTKEKFVAPILIPGNVQLLYLTADEVVAKLFIIPMDVKHKEPILDYTVDESIMQLLAARKRERQREKRRLTRPDTVITATPLEGQLKGILKSKLE